jgi:hypothetical protein
MTDHPITPPPELVQQWRDVPEYATGLEKLTMVTLTTAKLQEIATLAAQWGADQELEACVNWLDDTDCEDPQEVAQRLRAARRPKPPSLKERALEGLTRFVATGEFFSDQMKDLDTIRRALEALPE